MSYIVNGYKNQRVFEIFEDLCKIPHGSGNESGIADYIENFVSGLGLECDRDSTGNVFVKKSASAGYENIPPLLLQGHMDMVCEKNEGVEHDFEKDGLDLFVENGLLGARGTSLGGDNGIAVAMMLSLLSTDAHPALECLFTVEEETGLAGAKGFDCSKISARRMINLDSEEENTVTAGCAGGVRTEVVFESDKAEMPNGYAAYTVSVSGLAGGHSGADINTGRANAIVLLSRILQRALSEQDILICDISGGGKDNAIAREARATVACGDSEKFSLCVRDEAEKINRELCALDSGFEVKIESGSDKTCFSLDATKRMIGFLNLVKTGVLKFSTQIEGLVEYSRNLGIVVTEGGKVRITLSSRSSVEAQIDLSCREMDMLGELMGCLSVKHYSRYPGWEYETNSPLRERYLDLYEKMFGTRPTVAVIHAGLECGIISSKIQGLDIISIGPDMYDIHSPAERLSLSSCDKIYDVLLSFVSEKE